MQNLTMKNILLLLAAGLAVWLTFLLSDILLPFIAGFAVAYLLDPFVDRLERTGLPRLASTSVVMGCFALLLALAAFYGLPVLAEGLYELAEAFQEQFAKFRLWVAGLENGHLQDNEDFKAALKEISSTAVERLAGIAQIMLLQGLSFLNVLALLFITPIVSFYLLNDWDRMVARIDSLLPQKNADTLRALAREANEVLDGFVHGQAAICLFLAVFYATGLYLVGLNGGIAVGVLAGLVSFIPYVGSIFGVAVAGLLGLMQFWPMGNEGITGMLLIALVFGAGQFVEGNFLTPKLIGGKVRLHPVWIIFALLAFGSLLGFVGLLLAVPLAAVIGVLVRHAVGEYQNSNKNAGQG